MRNIFLLLLVWLSVYGCRSGFDDKSKHNQDWVWWVDDATGNGKWIKYGEKDPVKNGTYTEFYFNGNTYETGKLKDSKPVDTLCRYDIKGKLDCYVVMYGDSEGYYYFNDGPYERFFRDGKLLIKGIVKNHVEGDKWLVNNEDGRPEREWDIAGDNGYFYEYNDDGKLRFKMKGKILYTSDSAFNNIKVRVRALRYALQNGSAITYYGLGQPKDSVQILNGLVDGVVVDWYDNGNVHARLKVSKGLPEGIQYAYHENGRIAMVCAAKDGAYIGKMIKYDDKGKVILDTFYKYPVPY